MEAGNLRAKPFARNLEGEERPGAVLEEGVDLGEAGEPAVGLAPAPVEVDPGLGLVENGEDVGSRQPFDPEQVRVGEGRGHQSRSLSRPTRKLKQAEAYWLTRLTVPTWQRLTLRVSDVSPSS